MTIRPATKNDFDALYALGKETPELSVGAEGPFMEPDEFLSAIENPRGVFLLAETDDEIAGFVYANTEDIERPTAMAWACFVYLAVAKNFRRRGIAAALYDACVAELKARGVKNVYGWANIESDGAIVQFLKKRGFAEGHAYRWMDKEI